MVQLATKINSKPDLANDTKCAWVEFQARVDMIELSVKMSQVGEDSQIGRDESNISSLDTLLMSFLVLESCTFLSLFTTCSTSRSTSTISA